MEILPWVNNWKKTFHMDKQDVTKDVTDLKIYNQESDSELS